jgi:hypothetical protein
MLKDYKAKTLKNKFQRPYYSPKVNSYEIDYVSSGEFGKQFRHYLAVININTKYLFMIPLRLNTNPTLQDTYAIIEQINTDLIALNRDMRIDNLRGDGDRKFGSIVDDVDGANVDIPQNNKVIRLGNYDNMVFTKNIFTKYLKENNISMYLNPSKFTNKNRVIDRAIRTIRDKIGEDQSKWLNKNIVQKAVDEYNHTKHSAFLNKFTPYEVQFNRDLEEYFIREHIEDSEKITEKQSIAGLFNYKRGNIILVHLDLSKTSQMFKKQRRAFNKLAEFQSYEHGNVKCILIKFEKNNYYMDSDEIIIPIYYTKFVSKDLDTIPNEYKQLL